jgi:ribose transport system permease protein
MSTATTDPGSASGPQLRGGRPRLRAAAILRGSLAERLSLPLAWGILVLIFTLIPKTSSTFPTIANFSTIFGAQTVIALLTLALLVPLTAGIYDLSVAFNLTLASMVLGVLNVNHGWALAPAMLVALAIATLVGFINGAIVVLFDLEPFIVTLGTGTFISGVVYWISHSNTISGISSSLVTPTIIDTFLGIPLIFYYGLALCLILFYLLEFNPIGRRLLLVGQSRVVAQLSGLRVGRLRWGALTFTGLLAGIAGVLYAGTNGSADPTSGTQFLLPAYAAAFLGATAIVPGRFNPFGSLIAVYFLVSGITGLQLLGVQSFVTDLFYGGALVVAIVLSRVARARAARARSQQ